MLATTLLLYAIGAALALIAYRRPAGTYGRALRLSFAQLAQTFPRIILALMAAGFLAQIVPAALIAGWLDAASGLKGVVLASLLGALVPSGPALAIPLAAVLAKAGAGTPQLVALVTAWSVFAIHRIIGNEVPLIGWRFTLVRLGSSGWAPFVCGAAAGLLVGNGPG
jgi:uncharacterized membrane protein YraQ (UPF0718 family)